MAVVGIQWHWWSGYNSSQTLEINIPPALVGAQVALRGVIGDGLHFAGIKGFRRRLPSGADQPVDFGQWPAWPAAIFDRISSVTFGLALGKRQSADGAARIDFWG